jgi:mRNA interferase MazF
MKKERPCVIVSTNSINFYASVVIVCPITDAYGKDSPIHVPIPETEGGLTKKSIVHCGQIRAIDKTRLEKKLGNLSDDTMNEITKGIAFSMDVPQQPQIIIHP